MVRKIALTVKGTFTSKLYGIRDFENLRQQLPPNIQISPWRYELDGKQRLHVHGTCTYTGKLPHFKHYWGAGWHVHSSPDPTEKWDNYITKDSLVSPATLEYQQSLHHYRRAEYLFQD